MKTCAFVELDQEDFVGHTRSEIKCSDCIKGYCPSRTVAFVAGNSFILCGAKKSSGEVLGAYRARTGSNLAIERPS